MGKMERAVVEDLSASLVREYLARKKLAKTLKLLDEEQAEHSSCVRSRLKLLKDLRIGKLMKRNKKLGYPLDSMVEVVVHFLLEHARVSRKPKYQEGETEARPPETAPSVLNCESQTSLRDVQNLLHPDEMDLLDAVTPSDQAGVDRIPSAITNIRTMSDSHASGDNSGLDTGVVSEEGVKLDLANNNHNHEMNVMTGALRTENVYRVSEGDDFGNRFDDGLITPRFDDGPSIPIFITSSCSSSGSEDSSTESYSDEESESSASSIIDLTKERNSRRDPQALGETALTFKVPKTDSVLAFTDDVDDDVEVIDVGIEETERDLPSTLRKSLCRGGQDRQGALVTLHEYEEVVSGRPSQLGVETVSRPGTQESGNTALSPRHLLWLHKNGDVHEDGDGEEDGGIGDGKSPPIMRIHTQLPNFRAGRILEGPLDTFRPHVNGNEMKNGLQTPLKAHTNGHIPNGVSGGLMNGHSLRNGSVQNGSVSYGRRGKSVFDTDADVDIATMAAQRDQLRGARSVRGMMAPVMSKEEDSHARSATRRLQLSKQRSESILGNHEILEAEEDNMFPQRDPGDGNDGDVRENMTRRRRGINQVGGVLSGLQGVGLRPSGDYLTDADRQGDIMAQSMRRHSLRGSKQSLMDGNYGNLDSATSSRMSVGSGSPEDYAAFRNESGDGSSEKKGKNLPRFIPNSHEDIQILNLQGFMDAASYGEDGSGTSRRKKKKLKGKRVNEAGVIDKVREAYKFGSKPRRKRTNRGSKSHLSDDDGEMVLRDIDDLDNKVAGLVLGPKITNKESAGRPITLEEASDLKTMLMGSPAQSMPNEWMIQNFKQNSNSNLSYGIIQKKGGPCGVLACVQAYMMKSLIFGSVVAPNTSPISPLRPSTREWSWALSAAITEILWKAGQEQKALLTLPGSFPHFNEHGVGRYSRDGLTETLTIHEFVEQHQLHDAVSSHLSAFTNESSAGCVLLLYSALLSRGIENVKTDMDAGGGHLINVHGYSSQEIVNLLITGQATTNTFNGEQTLGTEPGQMVVLHGVQHKSDIGFLSLFEHYDCYKVGPYLKSPQYPIWVVCCESHFSVIFSRDILVTSDSPSISRFDIYYYDGLAMQDDEIRLTLDLDGEEPDLAVVPPLEHCIRTKWHSAAVEWNGMDPIL